MMLAAFYDNPTLLALLGIFVLWFSMKRFGRRPNKSSHPFPASRSTSTASPTDGHHLDAPASVARWEVAMHDTARDLLGRLDSKIVIVEQLVRDANQATARLEAVLQRIEQAGGRDPRTPSEMSASTASVAADSSPAVTPSDAGQP